MKIKALSIAILMAVFVFPLTVHSETKMDAALKTKAKRSIDQGLHFLRGLQSEDGSWSKSVGITALALRAFLESPRNYNESDGPFITRPVNYILSKVQPNGSISESHQNVNYNTAVSITALKATNNSKYSKIIINGQNFLLGLQLDEAEGYKPDHKFYGGIGYGGDERPDLSNQYIALESLKKTDLNPDDPVWERALTFISRSQNNSETNDQVWAKNDGGFTYMPGYSPNGETNSYGGMTHAGLIGLLFAGTDKNDPRVQAAFNWIKEHYTLEDNPGALNKQGLFYYYNAFSKSMSAYGNTEIIDNKGVKHNWRNDLAKQLLSMQDKDGSWVNTTTRWWEGNKNLVTAWSVIALNHVVQ